jgi:hypothetical protein
MTFVFYYLRLAERLLKQESDEVARNGALKRMTSARGFPECPLLFYSSFPNVSKRPSALPC